MKLFGREKKRERGIPNYWDEAVDVAWHTFILHTRDYADYCRGRYGHAIHHQPTGEPDPHAYKLAYDRRAQAGPVDNSVWIAPAAGGAIVGGGGG